MKPDTLFSSGIALLIAICLIVLWSVFFPKQRQFVYAFVLDLWAVLRPLRMVILLLLLAYFAFTKPDQATDMFHAFSDDLKNWHFDYFAYYIVGLIVWAATTWYGTRVLLRLSDNRHRNETDLDEKISRRRRRIIEWIPRLAGIFPFIISFSALKKGDTGVWLCAIVAVLAIIFGALIWQRKKYMIMEPDEVRFDIKRLSWSELPKRTRAIGYACLIFFLVMLVAFLLPFGIELSQLIRPAAILSFSFATWTIGIVVVSYLDTRTPLPLFSVLLIVMVVFSLYNNNHYVRLSDKKIGEGDRPPVKEYYKNWVKSRQAEYSDSASIPVFIIAAQGGGIRAMHWTAGVLNTLDSLPGFYSQVFAISGVSGGSVGAVFYNTWYRDRLDRGGTYAQQDFEKMIACDGLSPLTAGLVYSDMLQRFLPFRVDCFDRAHMLENAWSIAYEKATTHNSFDAPFTSLWSKKDYKLPCLFLNTALSESGQKGIVTNVRLDTAYFTDVIDVLSLTSSDMMIKSAALMSARFPYVTPAGTIVSGDTVYGNFVDGGYVENTGLATAVQLLNMITDVADNEGKHDPVFRRVKPVIVYLKNGVDSVKPHKPTSVMQETVSPPKAFISAWDRSGVSMQSGVEMLVGKIRLPSEFYPIVLDRANVTLPLGWFLSETAQDSMLAQEKNIRNNNRDSYRAIEKLCIDKKPISKQASHQ